jgi:uncharacterized protein YPO0396
MLWLAGANNTEATSNQIKTILANRQLKGSLTMGIKPVYQSTVEGRPLTIGDDDIEKMLQLRRAKEWLQKRVDKVDGALKKIESDIISRIESGAKLPAFRQVRIEKALIVKLPDSE